MLYGHSEPSIRNAHARHMALFRSVSFNEHFVSEDSVVWKKFPEIDSIDIERALWSRDDRVEEKSRQSAYGYDTSYSDWGVTPSYYFGFDYLNQMIYCVSSFAVEIQRPITSVEPLDGMRRYNVLVVDMDMDVGPDYFIVYGDIDSILFSHTIGDYRFWEKYR